MQHKSELFRLGIRVCSRQEQQGERLHRGACLPHLERTACSPDQAAPFDPVDSPHRVQRLRRHAVSGKWSSVAIFLWNRWWLGGDILMEFNLTGELEQQGSVSASSSSRPFYSFMPVGPVRCERPLNEIKADVSDGVDLELKLWRSSSDISVGSSLCSFQINMAPNLQWKRHLVEKTDRSGVFSL